MVISDRLLQLQDKPYQATLLHIDANYRSWQYPWVILDLPSDHDRRSAFWRLMYLFSHNSTNKNDFSVLR